jgi:hypothetical protein
MLRIKENRWDGELGGTGDEKRQMANGRRETADGNLKPEAGGRSRLTGSRQQEAISGEQKKIKDSL